MSDEISKTPLILGVSGLRGIVGKSLTPEVATRYAAAFGSWLGDQEGVGSLPRVLLCRDGREGGDMFLDAASAGLRSVGCDVWDCDVQTTPAAGVIAKERGCHAAMIVTASHNPGEWNGLKCLMKTEGEFHAPDLAAAEQIIDRFNEGRFAFVEPDDVAERTYDNGVGILHVNAVGEAVARLGFGIEERAKGPKLRAVVDSVNASGSGTVLKMLTLMFADGVQLHGDEFGIFPHPPEPTRENLSGEGGLCDAVPGLKADIGFAQDPDADRLAIVDENGEYIGEEYTLVLCAMALLQQAAGKDGTGAKDCVIVTNLSTSRMVEDVAAHYGARVERTPVGEANVVQRMMKLIASGERVLLGGEGNGGVIWPEVVYVRDSLGSISLVLALMAVNQKSVSELVSQINELSPGGSGYSIVKKKVDIATKADAIPAVNAVSAWAGSVAGARIDLQDGVRVDFEEGDWIGSWVHVRASNTEAIMRLICEAPTETVAGEILARVEAAIAGGGG